MAARVIFLDRDGTLNVDHGYVGCLSQWQFVPGAVEALRRFRAAGYLLAVVSNQSGISRGLFTRGDVDRLHDQVQSLLRSQGASVELFAYCPHLRSQQCDCRKPNTALASEVERRLGVTVDYPASWTVGDKLSDVGFGMALGTQTALLRSTYWIADQHSARPTLIVGSLLEAATIIAKPTAHEP